jgi:hypothetical protein|tara:strand:+ start:207 stop:647 length:441 start_codon:yes stop_codon:yes gene_type:complete
MVTEAIPLVVSILDDNWTRANTDNIKPVVTDITTVDPERGKRIDLSRSDYVLLYETAHNEEAPELFYDFVNTRVNLTIDCRTSRGRSRLEKIEDELRRVIHLKRKGDATNYDRLLFKTRTDLSDRTKRMHRMTFQVEVVTLAEAIA